MVSWQVVLVLLTLANVCCSAPGNRLAVQAKNRALSFRVGQSLSNNTGTQKGNDNRNQDGKPQSFRRYIVEGGNPEMMGVPKLLVPYFASFVLDGVAVGLVMPLLPFHVMELGASAFQLSLVISANFVAQMIGCILMGKVSDTYGRRIALLACLAASALSFYSVSHARTLALVVVARAISGTLGGLVPVMQSAVADASAVKDRPKYLGRVMAAFGLGFVIGPAISTMLPASMTAAQKIRFAALFPFLGLLIAAAFAKETKSECESLFSKSSLMRRRTKSQQQAAPVTQAEASRPTNASARRIEVLLLVLNGFLNMFGFGMETIYAVFLKDTFGYGEEALSGLFAVNGLLTGGFQVFLIKPLIGAIGMPATLMLGNLLLAVGMIGLALVRYQVPHFLLFGCHILGYSMADTALVSLISRYSTQRSQGRDLSLNQAAQSCARILSPLLAGWLYELSRGSGTSSSGRWSQSWDSGSALRRIPVGALPFLIGGICPLVAVTVPVLLSLRKTPSETSDETS